MAARFGGKYSPAPTEAGEDAKARAHPFATKRVSRVGGRVNLLFVMPFPFLISAFRSDPGGLALNLACFAALMLAAWLTREGLHAEDAYESRRVAKRPAIPRKMLGSALTGAGLACAGLGDGSLVNAIVFGGLGVVLHALSFGVDPLKNKGFDGSDRHQSDRVARAVTGAETHLAAMSEAIGRTRDRGLEARVERFKTTARKMFRTVEEDPRDLTAARRFLSVYLQGASDATTKFADLYTCTQEPRAKADYVALLDDLDRNFAAKTDTLLLDNRTDLNVEMEVLRERLAREQV